jgi:hypothetical protein
MKTNVKLVCTRGHVPANVPDAITVDWIRATSFLMKRTGNPLALVKSIGKYLQVAYRQQSVVLSTEERMFLIIGDPTGMIARVSLQHESETYRMQSAEI